MESALSLPGYMNRKKKVVFECTYRNATLFKLQEPTDLTSGNI